MIHVFFVPGMFGSTIEYVLRSFTKEHSPIQAKILPDGSMHSYEKEKHIYNQDTLEDLKNINLNSITTPMYPFPTHHLPEILNQFDLYLNNTSQSVLVHATDLRSAELNILFQYHKVCVGAAKGLTIFCENNTHNIKNWNTAYQHWSEMQPWELREWFSLFYVEWVKEWIDSQYQVPDDFFKITNTDILYHTKLSLNKIINHCALTVANDLDRFVTEWQQAQQYVIDEFDLLDQIVDSTVNHIDFSWQPINVIAEAIVQQRLRTFGYEIRCDGLNIFPTNAKTLYNLLEKC